MYAPHRGRYIVASSPVALGAALVHDRPYTHALHAEKFGTNCQHCMAVVKACVPCPRSEIIGKKYFVHVFEVV